MFDPGLLLLTVVFMIVGMIVSGRLKSKFAEYSKIPTTSGMSGKEIAEKMLRDNDINDVQVISVEGQLTDHYNPASKTVNLSPDVYDGRNIAAAAVAAHECGHAVQHATAYTWLQMRSTLVPIVNFSSRMMNFVFIAMMFFAFTAHLYNQALLTIIILQAAITLFSLITLPVEIDASRRGLAWLDSARITGREEHAKAVDALKWAASTYIVAALASITTLLYFIMQYSGRRD
jgi:Zn-dependent membrane protease YugP